MSIPRHAALAAVLLAVVSPLSAATETLPAGAKPTKLDVRPASLALKSPFEYGQLVVTATLADGTTIDATRMVTVAAPAAVKASPTLQVRPAADGKGTLTLTLAGLTAAVPVEVSGQKATPELSFVRDVMPVMARLGCNQGTCHGAESGKGGFKLSLRGYDPLFDHRALSDDLGGRRLNRAAPEASLMLLKPIGAVPHVGGVLTQPGEPYYETIKGWIAAGVKLDLDKPKVKSIEVFPTASVIALPGQKQQLSVIATFVDGTKRDVTAEAFLDSSSTETATVDRAATITAVRRGEATVMARYEGAYAASTLIVMGDRTGFEWKPVEEYNWIDALVYEKLRQVKIQPSDVCTDGEFIRRVYLDLTGVPPTSAEVRAFLADTTASRTKREKLVDKLIGSDDFVEHWTNKWADLLQVNRKFLGVNGASAFRAWIRKAVETNMPYDQFVYEVLTGSGSNVDKPQAGYYKVLRTPDAVMENTTQLFLGVRFNCNKCHDHPFERWTQDQYYQMAAFFAQVQRSRDPKFPGNVGATTIDGGFPAVEVIADGKGGEVKHDRTGKVTPPVFPYTHGDLAAATAPRRVQAGKWLTSKENQYFAKSYVNRVWAYLLGTGLIEPIDDIRAGNPASNVKLLDRLTAEFVEKKFDVRHMMRLICKSRTYQHSVASNRWNADDALNYSRALPRRLPAEVLYDAIHRATGSISRLPGLPAGSRAATLLDSAQDAPGGFLDLFGKPPRESACECERVGGVQLGPVLTLVNGPVVGDAVRDPSNRIAALLVKEKDDRKVIEELYLSFLSRYPTDKEVAAGVKAIKDGEEDYAEMKAEADARLKALKAYEATIAAKIPAWEANLQRKAEWVPLDVVSVKSKGGALAKQPDGSILASGKAAANEVYTVVADTKLQGITAIRLEALSDQSLPNKGPGRSGSNGNFVLSEFKLAALEIGAKGRPAAVPLGKAQATFSQAGFEVGRAIDGNPTTGWAIYPDTGKTQEALFELKTPLTHAKGSQLTFTLDQRYGTDHVIGKFRIMATASKPPLSLTGANPALAAILAVEPAKRTPAQKATLEAAYRAQDTELARLQAEVNRVGLPVDKRQPGLQDLAWALLNSKAFQFNH